MFLFFIACIFCLKSKYALSDLQSSKKQDRFVSYRIKNQILDINITLLKDKLLERGSLNTRRNCAYYVLVKSDLSARFVGIPLGARQPYTLGVWKCDFTYFHSSFKYSAFLCKCPFSDASSDWLLYKLDHLLDIPKYSFI